MKSKYKHKQCITITKDNKVQEVMVVSAFLGETQDKYYRIIYTLINADDVYYRLDEDELNSIVVK